MFTRRRCAGGSIVAVVGTAAALMVFYVTGAFAAASPADKVVAAGDKTVVMTPVAGPNATLLTAVMKTSKPTDLILQVSLECSILTTVQNTGTSISTAQGQVRVWVEVDGDIVPVTSVSDPPQNTPTEGDATDKAVFCERLHTVDFMPTDNTDMITQYQKTKNANAFNWLRFNVGAATHTIVVYADLSASPAMGATNAQAIVGNRTLIVEPTKMANNAVIGPTGTG